MDAFINKVSAEEVNHAFDFANELASGVTISSHAVTATDSTGADATATIVDTSSLSGSVISARLQAGTDGQTYTVRYRATASDSEVLEKKLELRINNKLSRYP